MNGIYGFNAYLIVAGNLNALILCCGYFFSLFYSKEKINLLKEPMFWISSGLLLFNAGELLYSLYYPVLKEKGWDKGAEVFKAINNNLILILYTTYIIGFICTRLLPKYRKE